MARRFPAALALIVAFAGSGAKAVAAGPEVKFEGNAQRRTLLDPMQYQPFDAKNWGLLEGWANGPALTQAATQGKAVLIVTWATWYKTSYDGLKQAQAMYARYKDKGLVVVGVHRDRGFESAADVAKAQGIAFPFARDMGDKFRDALRVDQDPDFYVIDKAGRLRYADVETASVAAAVDEVVNETTEQAAAAKPADKPAPGDQATGGAVAKPDAAAYTAAKWPAANKGQLNARNFQGKPLPGKILGGGEAWISDKPSTEGKVVLVDFWATWCHWCHVAAPKMDRLHEQFKNDLVIIGLSDEPEAKVKDFLKQKPHAYAQATDVKATVKKALSIQGIPHVVVVSSDGVVRWQGNPNQEDFEKIVTDIVAADPAVQSRKKG